MNNSSSSTPNHKFYVKNCSLAAIATGERANSLLELRDKLYVVDEGCIYYHFWGARMNPNYIHTQHHNDFASWVFHRLHDNILAEKLGVIDPTEYDSLEELRQAIIETIENRLDEYETVIWTKKEERFHFIRSMIIVFDSHITISTPEDLTTTIEMLPPSSIYYHFIDARGRTPEKIDDFSGWLKMFGNQYDTLIENIQAIDPYFLTLTQVRDELSHVIHHYFNQCEVYNE